MKSGAWRKVDHLHLFEAPFRADPYAAYAKLRADEPVAFDTTLNAWVVTRAQDVQTVLKDAATYSSNRVDLARARFTDPALGPLLDTLGALMVQRDDPDHRRLRKLVHHAFERTAVERFADGIEVLARELLAPAAASGKLEFVSEFAVPLPILVISKIVGIPPEDRAKVKAWCDAFSIVALNFYAQISRAQLEEGRAGVAAFRAYLEARLDEARVSDDPCLLHTLAQAEADGERLTVDELLANVLLLLNAGNETTTILLSNGLYHLLTHPEAMERLRADRTLIPAAVEEMLRYEAPVHFVGRIARQEARLGEEVIGKGDLVLVFLASAGRDEVRFEKPEAFVVDRSANRHQAFGNGPHLCAGVQLARLEARVAFEVLLDVFTEVRLTDEPLKYGPNLNLRALASLPVLVTPR